MLPFWKVRRELVRIFGHIFSLPIRLFGFLFGRLYYDSFLRRKSQVYNGAMGLGGRVCIYAIYPSIQACTTQLLAMDSIINDDFSLIVVSNKKLLPQVREVVLSKCSVLIERVNFGYDFGAYRDGVLYLAANGVLRNIEYLWLLNDSCWYPLSGRSWPNSALALKMDFVAATSKFKLSEKLNIRDHHLDADNLATTRNFHYASYCLLISSNLLRNREFSNFFQYVAISNSKRYTVRRGEIGLTRLVLKTKHSHRATHEITLLKDALAELNDSGVIDLIKNLTTLNGNLLYIDKERILNRISGGAFQSLADRVIAENFVIRCVARQGLCYTLPVWLIQDLKFPFLKKSLRLMNRGNEKIIRSFALTSLPEGSVVRGEILH